MSKKEYETVKGELAEIKKKLEDLDKVVEKGMREALYRTITVVKGPRKQGDPEKRVETEEVHVLDFLCHYLPLIEASMRGMQADIGKTKNNVSRNNDQLQITNKVLETMGKTLLDMEASAKMIAMFSDGIKQLPSRELKLLKMDKVNESNPK